MTCYVIVTCCSLLWTLLTTVITLVTLYCLTSSSWLLGIERSYSDEYIVVESNITSWEQKYIYDRSTTITNSYIPTIGLYSTCSRTTSSGHNVMSCESFAGTIGDNNELFPIPWQVSLVMAGVASLLLLFTMICALLSICVRSFFKKSLFTISGLIQVISGLILSVPVAIYPIGWSSTKLHYFCGSNVTAFYKDQCSIGWAYIGMIICTVCIFPTGMLSIKADRDTSKDEIDDEILQGKRVICIK